MTRDFQNEFSWWIVRLFLRWAGAWVPEWRIADRQIREESAQVTIDLIADALKSIPTKESTHDLD